MNVAWFTVRSAMIVIVAAAAGFFMRMMFVPMIVTVIMAAAACVAMLVMVMRFGIDERGAELALDRDRHFAWAILVLDQKTHHLSPETHIIDRAEIMPPQPALAVENQ